MPTLGKAIDECTVLAETRDDHYLLVNNASKRWAVLSKSAFEAVASGNAHLPSHLSALPVIPTNKPAESLFIIYKLTDRCNYSCSYCYDKHTLRPRDRDLRNRRIREILDSTLASGKTANLLFHGGEPLLELDEIVAITEEYEQYWPTRISYSIQTNGSLLDERAIRLFDQFNFGVCVSVDGTTASSNRLRITSKDNAYTTLLRKLDQFPGFGPARVGLLITVGAHNISDVLVSLLQLQKAGFKSASLSFMQSTSEAAKPAAPAQIAALLRDIGVMIVDQRLDNLFVGNFAQWISKILLGRSSLVCLDSPCGAGRTLLTVYPSGEVGPCDSIFDEAYLSKDLVAYELARTVGPTSALIARSLDEIEPCRRCDVRGFCNGTCPGNVVLEKGELIGVATSECQTNYFIIRELMWFLAQPGATAGVASYYKKHSSIRGLPK